MSTIRSWIGGNGVFTTRSNWTPPGVPASGDTLWIPTGTVDARRDSLSGLQVNLAAAPVGATHAPASPPAPTLWFGNSVVSANTTIELGNQPPRGRESDAPHGTRAAIRTEGITLNLGTIAAEAAPGFSTMGDPTSLTITVGPAPATGTARPQGDQVLVNGGTLAVRPGHGFARPSTLAVRGASPTAQLWNSGLIESGGTVRIDLAVLGDGRIAFSPPLSLSTIGPRQGAGLTLDGPVGDGQIIDFRAADGSDSHGTLTLGDPGGFDGLIENFTASTGNVGGLHRDRIALPGVNVSSVSYSGDGHGGVLAVRAGQATVAHLRFSGRHGSGSFIVLHPAEGGSAIELRA
ncbi:conserved protein of unknown function [Rhodovastum atsumiense]|uniref:Uncharacterized protein n=1 Tax=Rhodovastum atsumiense TaxID=504468 RepID=A0A5M6IRC1_9PROT|nr:hypothetical protein [Rhodovastum atsumiense]KAA5610015.1 hypothetical protein F1189_21145 [Rhodovastum atsumiense]CAH2603001.1 conserved protein of unknown function [Rhodovastum atsumiense]